MEACPSSSVSSQDPTGVGLSRQAAAWPSRVESGFGEEGRGSFGVYRYDATRSVGATNLGKPKIASVRSAGAFSGLI